MYPLSCVVCYTRYRDAELLHGRMGMLAVAGILAAEKFHPVFPDASGTAHEQLARVNELVPVSHI